jgi:integrase
MATVTRRGRSWVLNWSEAGRQYRKSLGPVTPAEAETARLAKEYELHSGQRILRGGVMFGQLAEQYLKWHASEFPDSTFRVEQLVRQYLMPAFQYVGIDQLQPFQVETYKADRLADAASATVAKEVRTLKAMLNKALHWQLVAYNPIQGVQPPRDVRSAPPHWYTMEQLHALYSAAEDYRPVWQLLANTGLRRSEAMHLKREHVRPDSILILSEPGARTKSRRWREVPLSDNARAAIEALPGREYVLPVIAPPSLSRAAIRDAARAGVGGSIHSLRHTFGTHMAMKGVPVNVLKELMGHSSIRVTERYMHVAADHLKDAFRGFNI